MKLIVARVAKVSDHKVSYGTQEKFSGHSNLKIYSIYSLYRAKEITKKVCNIINLIKS